MDRGDTDLAVAKALNASKARVAHDLTIVVLGRKMRMEVSSSGHSRLEAVVVWCCGVAVLL